MHTQSCLTACKAFHYSKGKKKVVFPFITSILVTGKALRGIYSDKANLKCLGLAAEQRLLNHRGPSASLHGPTTELAHHNQCYHHCRYHIWEPLF